ncbi:MAG: DUF559 domain-containing protein [Nocardioidaceae bacterium]
MPSHQARLRQEGRRACLPLALSELEACGISRGRARGPGWRRTSYGYYAPAGVGMTHGGPSPLQRILDASPLVPELGAFTGWAAAYLAGVAALDGHDSNTVQPLAVPISLGGPSGRGLCSNVVYLRDQLCEEEVRTTTLRIPDLANGSAVSVAVRTTVAVRATYDAMRRARDLAEAVATIDACTHALWVRLADLQGFLSARQGARRITMVRQAVSMADPAARSPWESRLRVFYVEVAGLPRPGVNVPIFDRVGRLLGIADLLDEEAGLVTEFDGAQHHERGQHRADNEREELFEDAGLTVVRADSLDLARYPARLVSRLRSGSRRGRARDRRRDLWTVEAPPWWEERCG